MAVKPIPDAYHAVTPILIVRGASKLIEFLKRAFGAEEVRRFTLPDGSISHAEVRIADSMVMMADAGGEFGPMPGRIQLYVRDIDATFERALEAGATSLREPADQFYGDRSGGVKDEFGNQCWIATHKEDVSTEEMRRRAEALRK